MKIQLSVNKSQFQRFLELTGLGGDIQTKEGLLTCKNSIISILARSYNKVVLYKGSWNIECKDDFQIGIDDITSLQKFVSNFPTDTINLKISETKLELSSTSPKLTFSIPLRKPEYILTKIDESKFTSYLSTSTTNPINLQQAIIKSITNYSTLLGGKSLILTGEGTNLVLQVENNQNTVVAEFDLKQTFNPFTTKISNLFVDLLNVINSDITLSVAKENTPVYVKTEMEKLTFEYLIAPLEIKSKE